MFITCSLYNINIQQGNTRCILAGILSIQLKSLMGDKETNLKRTCSYDDFVILIDRSSSFEKYKKIFEYLNIPLTIYRDKAITKSVDILLLKNIYSLHFSFL